MFQLFHHLLILGIVSFKKKAKNSGSSVLVFYFSFNLYWAYEMIFGIFFMFISFWIPSVVKGLFKSFACLKFFLSYSYRFIYERFFMYGVRRGSKHRKEWSFIMEKWKRKVDHWSCRRKLDGVCFVLDIYFVRYSYLRDGLYWKEPKVGLKIVNDYISNKYNWFEDSLSHLFHFRSVNFMKNSF